MAVFVCVLLCVCVAREYASVWCTWHVRGGRDPIHAPRLLLEVVLVCGDAI